jgi:NADH:ubiquinone oxidoreductase subunit C
MSISFILRLISGTLGGGSRSAKPETISGEVERAKHRATKRINRAKARAENELGNLDRVRISLMSGDMKKFTALFAQLKNVDFHDCENLSGLDHFNKERKSWNELENMSSKAMTVVNMNSAMDAIGFGAGVLDQYAVVPEIEGLEEYGEKEDTPEALKEISEKLQKFQQEVKHMCVLMQEVRHQARRGEDALMDLSDYFEDGIDDIKSIVTSNGYDWKKYDPEQKILIGRTAQIALLIRALSEIRFLNDDVTVREEILDSIDTAEELLDELGA